MSKRTPIAHDTEAKILLESARRCALCYGLYGNLSRKQGQIAHIDHNSSNSAETNLVYLCLEHHDEYDTSTSQSKGVTAREVVEYKRRLLNAIANGEHAKFERAIAENRERKDAIGAHDARIFEESNSIMAERVFREFLDWLQTDDSYFMSEMRTIHRFRYFFADTGNQYIIDDLSKRLSALLSTVDSLVAFTARNFFVFPRRQENSDDYRLCLYPELNIDRGGSCGPEEMSRYDDFQRQLDVLADAARIAYKEYRTTVKSTLTI